MKIGIIASELYDGGEITWTKVLCSCLLSLEEIKVINIYVSKDYDMWVREFADINKAIVNKVDWNFRFGINYKIKIIKVIIKILTLFKNSFVKRIFKFQKLDNNDLIISPYVSTELLFTSKKYIVCPQDTRHLHKNNLKIGIMEKLKKYYAEFFYSLRLKNAYRIVVEANYIKEDLMRYYKIPEDRIFIIVSPILISKYEIKEERYLVIRNKYNLPSKFIFYPAHFIEDKNHIKLVKALKIIKDKYNEIIPLILVGSKKNNFDNVMKAIEKLNLERQVKYLGYIPDEDMPYLYKLSTALVMPTLFESVSMPIWEAFYLGVPVVSSNVFALPEQVGDAGLLFDPFNIEDMAEKIYNIWTDENLRAELVQKGYNRIKDLTLENYAKQWEDVIKEALNE